MLAVEKKFFVILIKFKNIKIQNMLNILVKLIFFIKFILKIHKKILFI